ncbi:hypothetical protein HDU98_010742 [Podochytrium sp. JEL0797]|nr:hypothetical protein HDU98_010742 [Podochytrium sp. JEL0797]
MHSSFDVTRTTSHTSLDTTSLGVSDTHSAGDLYGVLDFLSESSSFTEPRRASLASNASFASLSSPTSSPPSRSAVSSRTNSVDLDFSLLFDASTPLFDASTPRFDASTPHFDASTPRFDASTPHFDTPPKPHFDSSTPRFMLQDAAHPDLAHPAPLQSTGGGTAKITPQLAVALTQAQLRLSQLKKQRDSLPPSGYICRLCAIEGHWMENCILYKSNKHPQYNNAARAVALNIISPDSQHVLSSLPVVQQPQQLYTTQFYQQHKMQQQRMMREQQARMDQMQRQMEQMQFQEQQYYNQLQQQQQQQNYYHAQQHRQYQPQPQHAPQQQQPSFYADSPSSPTSAGSLGSCSRFEGIWTQHN